MIMLPFRLMWWLAKYFMWWPLRGLFWDLPRWAVTRSQQPQPPQQGPRPR